MVTCPECGVEEQPIDWAGFGLDIVDITTQDDSEHGLKRYALRCQGCGYAGAFVAKPALRIKRIY